MHFIKKGNEWEANPRFCGTSITATGATYSSVFDQLMEANTRYRDKTKATSTAKAQRLQTEETKERMRANIRTNDR